MCTYFCATIMHTPVGSSSYDREHESDDKGFDGVIDNFDDICM